MPLPDAPRLHLSYADELDMSFTCIGVEASELGPPEFRLELKCRIKHPTGHFEYFGHKLSFEPDNFANFAKELRGIREGVTDSAALKNVGEMFVFKLERRGRHLQLTLNIREVFPLNGSACLSMNIAVDYDLFINKLGQQVGGFLSDVARLPDK